MTVRKLRTNRRGPKCSYCPDPASLRGLMFTKFSCKMHKPLLEAADAEQERRDSYVSEAEYSIGLDRY